MGLFPDRDRNNCDNCTAPCESEYSDGECTRSGLFVAILKGFSEGSEELLRKLFPPKEE